LDVVLDALLERKAEPVLDIVAAAAGGLPIRDRHGRIMTPKGVPIVLLSQASLVFQRLLYLRILTAGNGLIDDMAPERTSDRYWYPSRFKKEIGPKLLELIEVDAPSPLIRSGERALAELGSVETALRGDLAMEALSVWFTGILD